MPEKSMTKKFIKNLTYAFSAQGVALLLSALQILVLAKVLPQQEYSYYQLFIFYISYVGFFHFGLLDGIYLRTGGEHYHKLDFSLIGTQFWYMMAGQVLIAGGVCGFAALFVNNWQRQFVFYVTAANLILTNAAFYVGYIFQTTNHTKKFSISVMIGKASFLVFMIALILGRMRHFELYTVLYLVGQALSLGYCLYVGRAFLFAPLARPKTVLREMGVNISVGINLMLSNIASMLIVGMGRIMMDLHWGISDFGKFSFAVSLTNFFLLFISQVSMVLFPALRQADDGSVSRLYSVIRDALGALLPAILLCYLPIRMILGMWLPQYKESLEYLALLLPLCTFDGKMQMLCNTYLKVLRKERIILLINAISVAVSILLSAIGAFILNDINAIVLFLVVTVALRSIIAELYLSRLMGKSIVKNLIGECLLAVLFVALSWYATSVIAFVVYAGVYAVYLVIWRRNLTGMFGAVRRMIRR